VTEERSDQQIAIEAVADRAARDPQRKAASGRVPDQDFLAARR
jgi:hypothetical protein